MSNEGQEEKEDEKTDLPKTTKKKKKRKSGRGGQGSRSRRDETFFARRSVERKGEGETGDVVGVNMCARVPAVDAFVQVSITDT